MKLKLDHNPDPCEKCNCDETDKIKIKFYEECIKNLIVLSYDDYGYRAQAELLTIMTESFENNSVELSLMENLGLLILETENKYFKEEA